MRAVKDKDLIKALKSAGCTEGRSKGRHVVWYCPCGQHTASVPTGHGEVSPGSLRNVRQTLVCVSGLPG